MSLSKTDPIKRKNRSARTYSSSSEEEPDLFYLISYKENNQEIFSMVPEKWIKIDKENADACMLKYRGKK